MRKSRFCYLLRLRKPKKCNEYYSLPNSFQNCLFFGFFLIYKGNGNRDMISSSIYEWEWNKYDTPHDHILKN